MTEITVVTTFHQAGMELYGQKFIDSFAAKVESKIKLLVYAEDCIPIIPSDNIILLDAKKELPKLNQFKQKWKNVPKANGICPPEIKARRPRDWHKEFKWNAIRFANKVYAVFDACEKSKDWCVWMDADTIVHSSWRYSQFLSLLPEQYYITYVGRGKGSQTWPECGFYGLNLNHSVCHSFLQDFEKMYEDAENGIFKLEEWHDSYVFGHIINKYKHFNAELDYSAEMYIKHAKTGGGGHPLINCILGTWIDHLKGDRKRLGKSKKTDIMVNRSESYWRN